MIRGGGDKDRGYPIQVRKKGVSSHSISWTDDHGISAMIIDPQFGSAKDNDLTIESAVLLRSAD